MKSTILVILFAIITMTSAVKGQVWTTEFQFFNDPSGNYSGLVWGNGKIFTGGDYGSSPSYSCSRRFSPINGVMDWEKNDNIPTAIMDMSQFTSLDNKGKVVSFVRTVDSRWFLVFRDQNTGNFIDSAEVSASMLITSYRDSIIGLTNGNGSQGFIYDESGLQKRQLTIVPSGQTIQRPYPKTHGDTLYVFGSYFGGGKWHGFVQKTLLTTGQILWRTNIVDAIRTSGDIDSVGNVYAGSSIDTGSAAGVLIFRITKLNRTGTIVGVRDTVPNSTPESNIENFVNDFAVSKISNRVVLGGSSEESQILNTSTNNGYVWSCDLNLNPVTAFKIKQVSTYTGNTVLRMVFGNGALYVLGKSYSQSQPTKGWLKKYDSILTGVSGTPNHVPSGHVLNQNYPNPFNPKTKISFSIPKSGVVRLTVYDILGKEVETLIRERMPMGIHEVIFDGQHLSTGAYFYRLETDDFTETRKMMLIK